MIKKDYSQLENKKNIFNKDIKIYNKKFTDPYGEKSNNGKNNIILSKHISLGTDYRHTLKRVSVLSIGEQKEQIEHYIIPNIFQANMNYFIVDIDGEIQKNCIAFLQEQNYEIKILDLSDIKNSHHYNPFKYIHENKDIDTLVNCIFSNTSFEYIDLSKELLKSLILYIIENKSPEEQNFSNIMKLLYDIKIDKTLQINQVIKDLDISKLDKIVQNCIEQLSIFENNEIKILTKDDNINLESLCDSKQILFLNISSVDFNYMLLANMMCNQIIDSILYHIKNDYINGYYATNGLLKNFISKEELDNFSKNHPNWKIQKCTIEKAINPCHFIFSNFIHIGKIQEFWLKYEFIYKYNIFYSIFIKDFSELKSVYDENRFAIIKNCDVILFFRTNDTLTCKYLIDKIKNSEIILRNVDRKYIELKTTHLKDSLKSDELKNIDNEHCIVCISGMKGFYDNRFCM